MKRTKFIEPRIPLWYMNDPEQLYYMSCSEIKEQFTQWLENKSVNKLKYADLPRQFIYTREGLCSKMNRETFLDEIKPQLIEIILNKLNYER